MSKLTATKFDNRIRCVGTNKTKKPQETKIVQSGFQKNSFRKQKLNQLSETLPKTSNKAKDSQELRIENEKIDKKNNSDKQSEQNKLLLEKKNNITSSPQNSQEIIIVYEEHSQNNNCNKEEQRESPQNVSKIIDKSHESHEIQVVHEEVVKSNYDLQKEKQKELMDKINKKTAEYQANKPSSGVFTEVITHGAFTPKTLNKEQIKTEHLTSTKGNVLNGSKPLVGFPSSANDLALDAKSDLESDPNISKEVKEKIIEKLFALVSMVQHAYESKVRVMTEFEKFKDTHLKAELRREKEHSEQLYRLNMSFQNEVVQSIQRLKSELDISRIVIKNVDDDNSSAVMKSSSVDFNTSDDAQDLESNDKTNSIDDLIEQCNLECLPRANEEYKVNQLN